MPDRQNYLDAAYSLETPEQTRSHYNAWSASYDVEVAENGYASPRRAAEALAATAPDKSAPLMDLGCGTGLSGKAFHACGFTTIDGSDFSAAMIEKARDKGIYRELITVDLTTPMPFETGDYQMIAAVGVLVPGHAPASVIDDIVEKLPRGGQFVFSLNDHALEDRSYLGRVCENLDAGAARVLFREHGDHLPGIGLGSTIFVLEKT